MEGITGSHGLFAHAVEVDLFVTCLERILPSQIPSDLIAAGGDKRELLRESPICLCPPEEGENGYGALASESARKIGQTK